MPVRIRTRPMRHRLSVMAALTATALLGTSVASSSPAPRQPDSIVDNETVYVVAAATGVPRTTVVVDWLQLQGTGLLAISDPAPGADEIESLSADFSPEKQGDAVVATVDVEGYGDFFYRAETDAQLPLEVSVTYFLDGTEVAPSELAGRSGRLRIEIDLINNLERAQTVTYEATDGAMASREVTYTVPLLCIPQLEIDGTRMTDIVPPESAQLAIAGSTRTYAIPMMPTPEAHAVIEMDARDIVLAPMIISVFPKLPDSPDFSVVEEFSDLREGVEQLAMLSEGHLQVAQGVADGIAASDMSGAAEAAAGLAELTAGLGEMQEAADGLAALAGGQYMTLDGLIGGLESPEMSALPDVVAGVAQLRVTASQLETGTAGLVTLLQGQLDLARAVRDSNAALLAEASGFAAEYGAYSDDATSQAAAADFASLVASLETEQALLDALIEGADLGSGYVPGLESTLASLQDTRDGLTALRAGLESLESGLTTLPGAISQIRDGLVVLRDGGDPDGAGPSPYLPGLGATKDGLAALADGLAEAEAGLAGSAGELAALAEVPVLMNDLRATLDALAGGGDVRGSYLPGISTTVNALGEMSAGLRTGIDAMSEGEAITRAMKDAADNYRSFLGMPEGATGHVSFLYKLDGISK